MTSRRAFKDSRCGRNPVESLLESLARTQEFLSARGVHTAAIGGLALSVWGRARLTKDVDIKVALTRDDAHLLLSALPSEYQMLTEKPLESLQQIGFVFVQDPQGIRTDLLLSDNDFDDEVLKRAVVVTTDSGASIRVCTAEDLVVYKLIATRAHDQEDALNVILRQGKRLDSKYIENWLEQFEVALDDSTLVMTFRRMWQRLR
ncbi:MAG: hypothetical protein FJX76_23160 [Armatimonadetes bacterium]|nr:hypothetical protein [Armatimonadota bacterium]